MSVADKAPLSESEIEAWRQRIAADTRSRYHLAMGVAIRRTGEAPQAALHHFGACLAIDPANSRAWAESIELAEQLGDGAQAANLRAAAQAANPSYMLDALTAAVRDACDQGQPEWAEPPLARLRAEYPPDLPAVAEAEAEYLTFCGQRSRSQNQREQAVAFLRQAVEKAPWLDGPHRVLAHTLDEMGQTDAAIEEWLRLLAIAGDDAMANVRLGMHLINTSRHEEALPLLARVYATSPYDEHIANNYGFCLLAAGRYAEAMAVFEDVSNRVPASEFPRTYLGLANLALGNAETALGIWLRMDRDCTPDPNRKGFQAYALLHLGRNEEVRALVSGTDASAPVSLRTAEGLLALRDGQAAEAEARFRAIIADGNDVSAMWFCLGFALDSLGRTSEADQAYRRGQTGALLGLGLDLLPDGAEIRRRLDRLS
ncbi:hypothetical protein [Azospirillum endophyticum]